MAVLKSDKAKAEINFVDYNYGYVSYNLRLLYGDKPLFNPELLAEDPFTFDEYEMDYLIPFFEGLLAENKNALFDPLEPEVRIEAYFSQKYGLRDAENNPNLLYMKDGYKEELRQVDVDRENAGGKLPDDTFNFYFYVNEQKLKPWREETGAYGGFVPCMKIGVYRKDLEDFVVELKKDYEDWKTRNKEQIEYYTAEKAKRIADYKASEDEKVG